MATQIHAFGPNGELSPGAEAALEGLGGGVGGGSTTVQIGTVTLPEDPAEGQSVSVLADSETVLPEGITWDSGGEPVITERMLLVFVWSGTDWVGTYSPPIPAASVSPDTTPPTPGTLAASAITSSGFTLTVTGASDDVALHGTPYRFSTDNGATYSAWQAGATFNATGLDPETEYTCVHQVRDAALNVATGSSILVETEADTPVALALTYLDSGEQDTVSSGVFTFSSVPFGTEAADREVVFVFGCRNSSGSSPVTGVTIAGVTAALDYVGSEINSIVVARANIPTGTSGTVVVTHSSPNAINGKYGVYTLNREPIVDATARSGSKTVTLTGTTAGALIVAGSYVHSNGATCTWTGVTERFELGAQPFSGGDGVSAGGDVSVVATWTGGELGINTVAVAYR